jgi:hypothetical protein
MQLSPGVHATLQIPPHPSESPHFFPVQLGWQQILAPVQVWPLGHVHWPPQPSPELQILLPIPSRQDGMQQTRPPSTMLLTHSSPTPQPLQMPPQPSLSPHFLPAQLGWQHWLPMQGTPLGQLHVFPHPSSIPHLPGGQLPTQQPVPPSSSVWQLPVRHDDWQVPPQPSLCPQELGGQLGTQTHWPYTHVPASQFGVQQVSTQWPLLHTCVPGQATPAQGFGTQVGC